MAISNRCPVVLVASLFPLWLGVAPSSAQTFTPVFTKQYVRAAGAPVTVSDSFTVCDPKGTFRIVVVNGPGGQGRISSGSLLVNEVEVVQPQNFNQQVAQIVRPLTNVVQNNRLTVRLASGPAAAIQVSVEGIQNCGIRITSPAPGSTLTEPVVLVRGTVPVSPGTEVGVTINGNPALVGQGDFAALVPVDAQVTTLTATAADAIGATLSTDSISVKVQLTVTEPPLLFRAAPAVGLAPLTVRFVLASETPSVQVALDLRGTGSVDFRGPSLDGVSFTYPTPGLNVPTVTVTDSSGVTRSAAALVRVYAVAELDALLQAKWRGLKDALRQGDVNQALTFISRGKRTSYQRMLAALGSQLANIDHILTSVTFVELRNIRAEYQMLRADGGTTSSHLVVFALDEDGIWRLSFF